MNISEAGAAQTLLVAIAGVAIPDDDDRVLVERAGVLLADRAYKALGAGLNGARWQERFGAAQRGLSREQLRGPAIAACRVAWEALEGTSWDHDCPNPEKWIEEELDVLVPALEALGLVVEPETPAIGGAR